MWTRFFGFLKNGNDYGLPKTFSRSAWLTGLGGFVVTYLSTFIFVHPLADTRICTGHLPDPSFAIIPLSRSWYFITHHLYIFMVLATGAALIVQAVVARDQRLVLRFLAALAFMAVMRGITIALFPLCRFTVETGTSALSHLPTVDLGFVQIPWRPFASNDLMFSGHVGAFILLSRATRPWPAAARWTIHAFQLAQIYGLLATRGHYLLDILVAFPCAYLADFLAVKTLSWLESRRAVRLGVPDASTTR